MAVPTPGEPGGVASSWGKGTEPETFGLTLQHEMLAPSLAQRKGSCPLRKVISTPVAPTGIWTVVALPVFTTYHVKLMEMEFLASFGGWEGLYLSHLEVLKPID